MPQRIRPEMAKKVVTVFFRVNRVMRDGVIRVSSGGKELARFKRAHMAPGEMEHILLPVTLLDRAEGRIAVSAEEAEK